MDEKIIIKNANLKATINLIGAELISLTKDDEEYIWQGEAKYWAGHAPVLFPVCGGLKDDKYFLEGKAYILTKHGFAKKKMFSIFEKKENAVTLVLCEDESTLISFPFKFKFYVSYILTDKLTIEYKVYNVDEKTMFFTIGAHEGYQLNDDFENYSIEFEKKEDLNSYILNGNLLENKYINIGNNTNELRLNYDYFKIDALVFKDIKSRKVYLKHKTKGRIVTIDFNDFNHLLLWTKPNAKYICIEPWIAVPDMIDSNQEITQKPNVVKLEQKNIYSVKHSIKL